MKIEKHKRWFLLGINFSFVAWGVLYILLLFLNIQYGHYRAELLQNRVVDVILDITGVLHAVAFGFLFVGLYNGVVFLGKRLIAKIRERKQRANSVCEGERVMGKRLT